MVDCNGFHFSLLLLIFEIVQFTYFIYCILCLCLFTDSNVNITSFRWAIMYSAYTFNLSKTLINETLFQELVMASTSLLLS